MNHADATRDGVRGVADHDGLIVYTDLARVGGDEPVDDVHERRLAGAILAEKSMDLAAPQVEVDPVIGDRPGETLRDAA